MNSLEILEQAVNLLRSAPLPAVLAYLTGAVPFSIALLFFLNDMNRSPFAFDHLAGASAGVAAMYIWKNIWQAIFARKLYQTLSPEQPRASLLKLILFQAAVQPVGLALALPFPWLVAYFRNAALIAALGWPRPLRTARTQAVLWTKQNWGILALMTAGALLLFANILLTIAIVPQLARSFLGIEGDLARLGARIVNLTTIAVAATLTWMVVDPLFDAVYALRVFYGESITSAEDLRAALRRAIAAAVLLVILIVPARAQVDPVKLDHSIDQVIHSREFTWRAPHPAGEQPQGHWVGWIRDAENLVSRGWQWVKKIIRGLFERKSQTEGNGKDAPVTPRMLEAMIVIAVAMVGAAAYVFFSRRRGKVVAAEAVTLAAVNVADESVTADQLPESSWLKLAEDLLAKGDCRLALRALYLAELNYLGERQLVSIRRWKSGFDYKREIERRSRSKADLRCIFAQNIDIFERGWYGTRAVDREMVEALESGLAEMRQRVEQV